MDGGAAVTTVVIIMKSMEDWAQPGDASTQNQAPMHVVCVERYGWLLHRDATDGYR
jgi:hypothetical protein